MQLQAAVEKWGEGNWTDIAGRDDFTIDKTAAQLSK
ncbi:telomeric repeat-binding factor 2-like, partial [Trifolium medium]|nr:telomeric repeat-binding factor 2-like [Trifolium medium]